MRTWTIVAALAMSVTGCASDGIEDDLAGEDGDGVDDGKADDTGAFTYYQVTGTKIASVNKASMTCPDGAARASCTIERVDYARTGLAEDEVTKATAGGKAILVRGTLAGKVLTATELWVGKKPTGGVFVKVRDAAVTCTTLACESRDEIKLNSTRRAQAADLDFEPSGASEADAANAQAAIGRDGLIIAGDRYTSSGVRARTVTGYYLRVGSRKAWNIHDVSILFPLKDGEENLLLPMRSATHVLFTEDMLKILGTPGTGMPYLVEGPGRDQLYPKLRVVSARIDPCFDVPAPTATTKCVRSVRLVAQPTDTGASFYDASIHLFYTLDDAAFVQLLTRMRGVSLGGAGPALLGAHPTMAAEGLAGATAKEIKAALLEACKLDRLTRFTVMATGRSKNWFFFTLEPTSTGTFARVQGMTKEGSFTDQGLPMQRQPVPLNDPAFPDDMLSTESMMALSEDKLLAGIDKLQKISNPHLARTSETKCASCHAVSTTLEHALELREISLLPRTRNAYAPTPFIAAAQRNGFSNHHAFSYFGSTPTVTRRVVNDSVETVRFLASQTFLSSLAPDLRARLP